MSKGSPRPLIARLDTLMPGAPPGTNASAVVGEVPSPYSRRIRLTVGYIDGKVGELTINGDQVAWLTQDEIVSLHQQLDHYINFGAQTKPYDETADPDRPDIWRRETEPK
jgi:hypothetical protein